MISVLDYGSGNVGSVINMIERAGGSARRISTPEEVIASEKLLLPGVGAFGHGMSQLVTRGLVPALNCLYSGERIPILGLCLGMQLMCRSSEEASIDGLGWFGAEVRRFVPDGQKKLRIPHMGWNTVRVVRPNPLLSTEGEENRFYFVHSYRVVCDDDSDPVAVTEYGGEFVAAFQKKNIFGVQFHPEKSHRFGMELMRRFVEIPIA